jgi:hypothetical protein
VAFLYYPNILLGETEKNRENLRTAGALAEIQTHNLWNASLECPGYARKCLVIKYFMWIELFKSVLKHFFRVL